MDVIAALCLFLLPIVAAAIVFIHIRWKKIAGWQAIGTVLMWQLAVGLGLGLIRGGIGHLLSLTGLLRRSAGRQEVRSSARSGCGTSASVSSPSSA
ncbi:hypothetical protein [Methanoculleus frigidifontis]|uniref:hypothetical protein n=1 Tax=Methanoculleus frigidifontis TaxID=2584085 RepID=UPI002658A430|nr:hypothetical protein [Methanoculleus sp. FWC-SCC1]